MFLPHPSSPTSIETQQGINNHIQDKTMQKTFLEGRTNKSDKDDKDKGKKNREEIKCYKNKNAKDYYQKKEGKRFLGSP